ncbi:MAG: hypothetical protein KDK10_16445, partial [Maritimibacter sp.]|nr:hypothetical protein [Maritimibacter sp.]
FEQAEQVLAEMRGAGFDPDVPNFAKLMSLAESFEQAERGISEWKSYGEGANQVFGRLTAALSEKRSAEELFDTCFGAANSQGMKFPTSAFQDAVIQYTKHGRINEALRIAVAFPHLPGSKKTMGSYPDEASHFFQSHFQSEPNHASYALARLFETTKEYARMREWARIAMEQERQPPSRIDDIKRMLALDVPEE